MIIENNQFAQNFELKLAGVVSKVVMESIVNNGLKNYINNLGYVSHEDALNLQHQSQLLLLIEIDSEETQMIIPGKLFEYIQSGRPILSLGPKNADFATIIKETETGSFFLYSEKELLKKQVLKYFEAFLEKKLSVSPKGIEKYTRENLTAQLLSLIHI